MRPYNAALRKLKRATRSQAKSNTVDAHPVDKHVGQQIRIWRIQSNVTQSGLAAGIGVSFQQIQKYENGKNRVSASMLYKTATFLRTPISRFFEGLPEPAEGTRELPVTDIDERIAYISTSEGRQLIEDVLHLSPKVRSRVAALVGSFADEGEGRPSAKLPSAGRA
jgi:transcriptional regulator with XRE-family HTH domain